MVTDRTDFTESAIAVPPKTILIESGTEYTNFKNVENLSYPNALARVGIWHHMIIRIDLPGWITLTKNPVLGFIITRHRD